MNIEHETNYIYTYFCWDVIYQRGPDFRSGLDEMLLTSVAPFTNMA